MSLQIKSVAIASLVNDPQNVREHDERNLDAIKSSLSTFGQRKPIVCARANDGRLVVVAGNGTLMAAKALGWTDIDTVEVPKDWDAEKIRAFGIADNRTAELANWNDVALASALVDLDAMGWNIADLGFEPLNPPTGDEWDNAMDGLGGDRQPLQQMTFTLHDDQVELLKRAMNRAKNLGDFGDTGNPNDNGNALARIAEMFMGIQHD